MEKISEKAKKSVKENINPACVGRCGFVGLEPHIESRWNQLVSSYPHLDAIEHPSSIKNTVSKARLNPVTKLYELRENLISNGDLTGLLELLDKKEKQKQLKDDGSYSTKKNKNEALETTSGEILGSPGMGLAAGSSSEILSIKKCELLHLDDQGALKVVAIGRVHPTDDRVVHGCPIIDGFVKVQIDRVVEGCGSTRLLPESCIYGEIELLKDAKGSFIQWPVKLIKILNKDSQTVEPCHHFISTPYRPQFEATPADQQAIPNERNEYQIYSYALQDDETFNQLFSENTTAEHVSFRKPTELVHAYQHTKPVIANQPTKTVHANQSTEPIRDCQHTKPIVVASKSSTEKIKVSKEKIKVLELLEMARSRPQNIYRLAQKVALHSEKALFTVFTSPTGMYEERVEETVEFEAVIQLCVNGWADICFVHWFTMYLYAAGEREGLNNTAYFHPRYIEGELVSDDGDFVIDHIKKVISFHKDKQWFIAPYIAGKHWVLIILQHHPVYKTWKGYIFDSRKGKDDDDYSCYEITTLFEQAIEENMTWAKVKCRLQPNGWECGYCVMLAMYDFVIRNREHMLANKTKMVRQGEIDEFVERTLKVFISSFGDVEDENDQ
ncbi:putative papain-like cysteine peptidase superfamily [Helianthus annuus]|nr:putative papain-like cysteine peptidase superfamily [Helianthus annuus]KAJ0499562.1 putative papain-like cysteine peptidase superfamily [Helianthus annuus]KAJ0665576.1 putative papain-like cysteine peptidase superfamily [Helianthus annuus]KAJ0673024.1 putative papain-like cysteine peptidase superfamily [Helianthus annuus]